jgi:hypothetical protein
MKETWVDLDVWVREESRRTSGAMCHLHSPTRRGRACEGVSPPTTPLTASWLLRLLPDQGRSTLGRVLGKIKIFTAKKRVRQSFAGQFPCNSVLYFMVWDKATLAACALCGHHAATQRQTAESHAVPLPSSKRGQELAPSGTSRDVG